MISTTLYQDLTRRGVIVHSPDATVIRDTPVDAFSPGVEIYPGCTITGACNFGPNTRLGRGGGGTFEDVTTGAGVDLFGGFFSSCVILDDVKVRGHAEIREGTLLEERCEAAHHVGYKMTIMMPFTVAGSLVNFCDALFTGGTSRKDHGEIGSCLALYNYTPWGDKFASRFGDVPQGVFLRAPRVFVGGQTRIVSPVRVGFGSVIAAGASLRRDVPGGTLVGDAPPVAGGVFDPVAYGGMTPKFVATCDYVGQLYALRAWYTSVRLAWAAAAPDAALVARETALYTRARSMIDANIRERIKRLDGVAAKLPASAARHRTLGEGDPSSATHETHARRAAEHDALAAQWPALRATLEQPPGTACDVLARLGDRLAAHRRETPGATTYVDAIRALDDALVEEGSRALALIVKTYAQD